MGRPRNLAAVILGMAVVLLLVSSTASATTLTSPTGTVATPTIKVESEGHVVLDNPIAKIECSSSFENAVESHGVQKDASGKVSELGFAACTDSWHVTVVASGTLAVSYTTGSNGTVRSSGTTVEATRFGISCRYATSNTPVGTVTGGSPATIDISGSIPFHSGSIFCGSGTTAWTGGYKVTSPTSLYVDEAPGSQFITSPTGSSAPPTLNAASEGKMTFEAPTVKLECDLTIEGIVKGTEGGSSGAITMTAFNFSGCSDSWDSVMIAGGSLRVDWTSGYDGTVIWDGGTIELTRFGMPCRYATSNTPIGTLTAGNPATIDISANLPFHSGSVSCPGGSNLTPVTGSLKVTSPASLYIDKVS
jgi:hypothetical protein